MLTSAYILVPCAGLLVCSILGTASFLRLEASRGRREFLLAVVAAALGNLCDILGFLEVSEGIEDTILRMGCTSSLALGIVAYAFASALTSRPLGRFGWAYALITVIAVATTLGSPLAVASHLRAEWGLTPIPGVLNIPVRLIPTIGGLAVGFRLWNGQRAVTSKDLQETLRSLAYGAFTLSALGTMSEVVVPNVVGHSELPRFTSAWLSFFIIFVARAPRHFDSLGLAMAQLVDEVFQTLDDGVLVVSSNDEILRCNKAAITLLGQEDSLIGSKLTEVLERSGTRHADGSISVRGPAAGGRERFLAVSPSKASSIRGVGGVECRAVLLRDVTETRSEEEHLRASHDAVLATERQLREVLDHLPLGLHAYHLIEDGRLILERANAAANSLLGVDHDQFVGKTIEEAFPSLAGTEIPGQYRSIAKAGGTWSHDEIQYEDDQIKGSFSVHAFSTGPNRVGVAFRDITEDKRSEAVLKESEHRFRTTFEQAAMGILHAGLDGSFLRMNQRFCELLGYSREELLSMDLLDVTQAGDEFIGLEQWRRLTRREIETFATERRFVARNQERIWVNLTISMHNAESEDGSYFIIVVEDITERKRVEGTLVRLSSAVENNPNPIIITNPAGHVSYVNSAFLESKGYSLHEVIGQPIDAFIFTGGRAPSGTTLSDAMASGVAWRGETRGLKNAGADYPVIVSIAPVWVEDSWKCSFVVVEQDMTAYRQMEEELTQTIKMQAIGQLTGGVAHDFNNLLTVIIASLSILLDEVTDPELHGVVTDALAAAERGGELTSQLLSFSRRQTLKPRQADLNLAVEHCIKLARRTLGDSIKIRRELGTNPWPVLCDIGQVENALLNLSINARDAMPSGGDLVFSTENRSLRSVLQGGPEPITPGDYVVVAVRDSGRGMSPSIMQRAFEPFFTTKEPGRGTGLGLSMVYGFVRQSGGFALIESSEGHGTTVSLFFPRFHIADDAARRSGSRISVLQGGDERILVVEDDPAVRRTTVRTLVSLGYDVVEAENATSALDLLEGGRQPDLLFSDVTMPGGMSGFELANTVTERWPAVRLLLTTGYADASQVAAETALAKDIEIVTKPFTPTILASTVRRTLGPPRHRPLDNDMRPRI